MFFKTQKRAELKVPYQTAPGEKLWSFVELELPLPLYVMRTEIEAEGVTLGGEVLTLDVMELIKFSERDPSHRLAAVDLLFNSPDQERRSFHRLNEIWRAPENGALRFIVDDGAALDLDLLGQGFDASTLQLIFRAPALQSSSHG